MTLLGGVYSDEPMGVAILDLLCATVHALLSYCRFSSAISHEQHEQDL